MLGSPMQGAELEVLDLLAGEAPHGRHLPVLVLPVQLTNPYAAVHDGDGVPVVMRVAPRIVIDTEQLKRRQVQPRLLLRLAYGAVDAPLPVVHVPARKRPLALLRFAFLRPEDQHDAPAVLDDRIGGHLGPADELMGLEALRIGAVGGPDECVAMGAVELRGHRS